jgi:hypothetical protein
MELTAFFDAIEAHDELEGIGIVLLKDDSDLLMVGHKPSGITTQIPAASVEGADWDVLESVLVGDREPEMLYHMTRVVGYYSRVQNWNASKMGELKDRQRGNYGF